MSQPCSPGQADVRTGTWTDPGLVHPHNEDAALVDDARGLYAIADGVGGHLAGEVASALAVERLPALLDQHLDERTGDVGTPLRAVLADLNDEVRAATVDRPERLGMATTVVLLLLRGPVAHVVHAGDSRAYLLRDHRLTALTEDHSYAVELIRAGLMTPDEAARHPQGRHITQAIGIRAEVTPTVSSVEIEPGDRLLLCSDGISDLIGPATITRVLDGGTDPEHTCRRLVDAANDAGGRDNSSAVVVDVRRVG